MVTPPSRSCTGEMTSAGSHPPCRQRAPTAIIQTSLLDADARQRSLDQGAADATAW